MNFQNYKIFIKTVYSSLERILPLLVQTLDRAKEKNPEDARLVYILSDGEATDDGQSALDDNDDVQNVYANFELPPELVAEME